MLKVSDTSKERGRSSPKKALRRRESNNLCRALAARERSPAARPLACLWSTNTPLGDSSRFLACSRLPRGVMPVGHGVQGCHHHITSHHITHITSHHITHITSHSHHNRITTSQFDEICEICVFREWCGALPWILTKANDETVQRTNGAATAVPISNRICALHPQ